MQADTQTLVHDFRGGGVSGVSLHAVVPESTSLPICSACIEGWLARPEDGEPDRASVIWRDELLCGWHATLLADDAPAVHIFGRRPESEWGRRVG